MGDLAKQEDTDRSCNVTDELFLAAAFREKKHSNPTINILKKLSHLYNTFNFLT